MVILWIISIVAMVLCLNSICNETRNLRFEIRNLKDYLGRDGILGELERIREELLTKDE